MLSACSSILIDDKQAKLKDKNYEFIAVGYAPITIQNGSSYDIKMLNAIKASKLDAYKELAEQVYGVMLTSDNSVKDLQLQSETLNTKVKGLVRGARVIRTYNEGDLYITELGLDMTALQFVEQAEFVTDENVIKVQPQVYY